MHIKDIWQMCLGHADGWNTVYDTTQDNNIKNTCEKLLRRVSQLKPEPTNQIRQMRIASPESIFDNPECCLTGFYCDEYAVYIYKTQYGLWAVDDISLTSQELSEKWRSDNNESDRVNAQLRDTSFSHAYIFPWSSDDYSSDRLNYLTLLNKDMFKSTLGDVIAIQDESIQDNNYDLFSALKKLEMSQEQYEYLINSVFYRLIGNEKDSIFIQYDGSFEQMMLLLYSTLSGIPYHLRRRVTAANFDYFNGNSDDAIFRFSTNAGKQRLHINPWNIDESNILSKDKLNDLKNKQYVNHAVFLIEGYMQTYSSDEEFESFEDNMVTQYFAELNECLQDLFGDKQYSEEELDFAYRLTQIKDVKDFDEKFEDFNPIPELANTLAWGIQDSDRYDEYIANLIQYIIGAKKIISEKMEGFLIARVRDSGNEALHRSYNDYVFNSFRELSPESQNNKLLSLSPKEFNTYVDMLLANEEDRQILDGYFANVRVRGERGDNVIELFRDMLVLIMDHSHIAKQNQEILINVYCGNFNDKDRILEVLNREGLIEFKDYLYPFIFQFSEKWPITAAELKDKINNIFSSEMRRELRVAHFEKYKKNLKYLYLEDSTNAEYNECIENAKMFFWDRVSLHNFDIYQNYDEIKFDKYDKCSRFISLKHIIENYMRNGKDTELIKEIYMHFEDDEFKGYYRSNYDEKKLVCKFIQDKLESQYNPTDQYAKKRFLNGIKLTTLIQDSNCFLSFIDAYSKEAEYMKSSFIVGMQYEGLISSLYNLFTAVQQYDRSLLGYFVGDLVNICLYKDDIDKKRPVPLDLWLITGLFRNDYKPLDIFEVEEYPINILSFDPKQTIEESHYFGDKDILKAVELYLKEKGSKSRQIKTWLSAYKKLNGIKESIHDEPELMNTNDAGMVVPQSFSEQQNYGGSGVGDNGSFIGGNQPPNYGYSSPNEKVKNHYVGRNGVNANNQQNYVLKDSNMDGNNKGNRSDNNKKHDNPKQQESDKGIGAKIKGIKSIFSKGKK